MRIAYLPGAFPMPSETPVLNQVTGLVRRGHDVTIYGDRPRAGSPYHPSIDELGLLARARYRPDLPPTHLGRWKKSFALLRSASPDERRVLLRAMNVLRFGTRSATGRLALQAAQFLPPRRFDIIQAGFGEQGLKALRMLRVGAMAGPLLTAFRGADLTRFLRRRGRGVYRRLFRTGDLFMPVSRHFAERLERLGCPPERIVVHRTGIDLSLFPFEPRLPGPVLQVVTLGRLTAKKGIEDGLAAVAMLQAEGAAVRYTIAGDGPLRARLESVAAAIGVRDVEFTGPLGPGQVAELIRRSDLLLAPSVTAPDGDEEGIPNVLKEAMAAGRPVVTTRHSGIPELVEHQRTGFLAGEHDPAGLADAIRLVRDGRESLPALLEAARRLVEAEYDIEVLNDRLVETYRRFLS